MKSYVSLEAVLAAIEKTSSECNSMIARGNLNYLKAAVEILPKLNFDFETIGEIKLKACPFCGEKPYTRIVLNVNEPNRQRVDCVRLAVVCKCGIKIVQDFIICNTTFEELGSALLSVINKWNERVEL